MKAPDKIYLTPLLVEGCGKSLSKRVTDNDAVYIREDLIKAEIERQLAEHKDWSSFYHSRGKHSDFEKGAIFALNRVLNFINNLFGEKSTRQRLAEWSQTPEGRESYEKVAGEMRREAEEVEELEKEIQSFWLREKEKGEIVDGSIDDFITVQNVARHFADWQKARYHFFNEAWADKMQYQLDRNYENGKQAMKEQMMEGAISCNVFWHDGPLLDYTQEQQDNALERIGANVGDKVKIIIVKED